MLLMPAQIKPKLFESRRNSSFFFLIQGGCVSCLCACLGTRLLPQSYQYPNLLEGTDRICGQLCRDNECPFSGITKSGRVWRKIPESNARRVRLTLTHLQRPSTAIYALPNSQFVKLANEIKFTRALARFPSACFSPTGGKW